MGVAQLGAVFPDLLVAHVSAQTRHMLSLTMLGLRDAPKRGRAATDVSLQSMPLG